MVGPRVYHIKHARSYPAFTAQDPAKVMDLATHWLKGHDFKVKRKNRQYSRGSRRGIHVNFVPKYKLYIEQGPNGQYVVRFDYYAKIKLGTAVVVGVLTSGISTVVGVGTLAVALSDADNFVAKFWKYIDSLSRGNPVILTVERWASDGKGNFVQQPQPGVVVPVVPVAPAVPMVPIAPPPQSAQQLRVTSTQVNSTQANGTRGVLLPPQPQPQPQPQLQLQPQPLPLPPPRPQQNPPPAIQPGQVYGNYYQIQTPTQASAPPLYYLDKSNSFPPQPPRSNQPPAPPPRGFPTPPAPSPQYPPSAYSPNPYPYPPSAYQSPNPSPSPSQSQSPYPYQQGNYANYDGRDTAGTRQSYAETQRARENAVQPGRTADPQSNLYQNERKAQTASTAPSR